MDRVTESDVLGSISSGAKASLSIPDKEIEFEAGEFGAVLEALVRDRAGNIRHRLRMKSRSFTKQFIYILWCEACLQPFDWTTPLAGDYGIYFKDITGSWRSGVQPRYANLAMNGAAGATNRGIVVGTGTTTPTIDDYRLETQIAHGTGPGMLQYSAVTFGAPSTDGSVSQFTVTRDFANNSGSSVTVYEAGLYCYGFPGTAAYFCVVRDVITAGIVVNNGETLTLNYRIQAVL